MFITCGVGGYLTMKEGLDRFYDKEEGFRTLMRYLIKKDGYKG